MKFGVKTIVAIGIGTALFFLLARFVSFPIFANTNLTLQYGVLGFFAVVFGPIAGLLIGLLGHIITDLTWGGIWWGWVAGSAAAGLITGLICKGNQIEQGIFGKKDVIKFVIATVVSQLVAFMGIGPTTDLILYQEPASKVYMQGLVASAGNIVFTLIVGLLLLYGYSKTRTKTGSLQQDVDAAKKDDK